MKLGELPFVVAVGLVAAIALVGLVIVLEAGARDLVPLPFVAAIVFAVAYLWASHEPAPIDVAAPTEEPFDDPVEEADRIDSVPGAPETGTDAPPTAPTGEAATPPTPVPAEGPVPTPGTTLTGDDR